MADVCVTVPLGPACMNVTGVRAGDRNEVEMILKQGGGPVNLTGQTVTSQVRKKASDPDPAAITAVITVLDATAGRIKVKWPGADVRTLVNGATKWQGVWDLQISGGGEEPLTLVAGTWAAEADVTRP